MKPSIRIYNRFLDLKGELDSYQSLQFGRSYHGVATFELHTNRYMHESQKIEKGDIISLDKSGKKVGIVESKEISLDQNGKMGENFIFKGTSLNGLMNRRQTVPPDHTGYDRITASAEEALKHYVKRNFTSPDDHRRFMPNLEIAPTLNRGNRVEWESRYKNVADELENISIQSGLGWHVYADFRNKKYIFDVLESYDLTQGNPEGYNPVFFSPEFETAKSQEFIDSDQELRNFGYVGGEGEGAERKIISVGNSVGWDRRESFIDARDINGNDEEENLTEQEVEQLLIRRGEQRLGETETIRALESEILTPGEDSPFKYQHDFDLGDKVDVFNKSWNLKMSAPITGFLEVYEDSGFRIDATFGRAAPTLIQKVNNRLKRLEGVEQQELPSQIAVENKQYVDRRISAEEQERIRQAEENLQQSKRFTEEYAEKRRVESSEPPSDRSIIWVDTSDPKNVTWKIFSQELGEWVTAGRGPQGLPGPAGRDGTSLYTWLKYADDKQGNGMADSPEGKVYMGLSYNNDSHVESTNPRDYEWSKIEGEKGDTGVSGPPGADGEPRFTWIKYADDSRGTGMSDSPVGKEYIGLSYNQREVSESNHPNDYTWSLIKGDKGDRGEKGEKGDRGIQGIQGPKGTDGQPTYTWIRYADNSSGEGISATPANKEYIGLAPNKTTSTPSNNPQDYVWSKIKGEEGSRGQQGLQGPKGSDGQPTYTWIRYADNANGGGMANYPDGKLYIGLAYNKNTPNESSNPADYTWALIKGEKGEKGDRGSQGVQGPKGDNGQPTYTWIRYADNASGSGMSASPLNKKYIGLAPNRPTAAPSANANDYEWSLIKGEQGDRGQQGIQGPRGSDGNPTYTWVKYADNVSGGGLSNFPDGKEYIGFAYNKSTANESNNPSDYTWAKIKGDRGAEGSKGETGARGPQGERGSQGIQGPKGDNGQPTYTWVRYADNANGGGMSATPAGKEYIGIAPNKTTSTPSNVAGDYAWALIRGAQGSTGQQGIQGPRGSDGQPTYTWVRYADNVNGGGMSNFPDNKEYIGFAYNKSTPTESNNGSDYKWSKIKGDRGTQGPQGNTGDRGAQGPQGSQGPRGNTGDRGAQGPQGNTGPRGPQGPNVVDLSTVFGTGWFRVEHIQSLNGLNVNNQFVVDNNGNVSLGNDRIQFIAGGNQAGINIKEGAFTMEDKYSDGKYDIAPKSNLLLDHSFELMPLSGRHTANNNWWEIDVSPNLTGSQWQTVGNPKVTGTYYPVPKNAQPIFGNKAVVVRDAHYVRQYLQQSIAVGATYTLSAFFKRAWNANAGVPRIEVWHVTAQGGRQSRLFNATFPRVTNDYNERRYSVTFTTPNGFSFGDALEIIFSGGDDNWVQVDGAQLVESPIPVLYNPEDSLWNTLDATYIPINRMTNLWSGQIYPNAGQTATPTKPLSLCSNGWALEWRGYDVGTGWVNNNFQYTLVPKAILNNMTGNRVTLDMALSRYREPVYKYVAITGAGGTTITGDNVNGNGSSNRLALNRIYEW